MRNLYELTVRRGKTFFVIALTPNEAQNILKTLLDKAEWWFSKDRDVVNIKLIATEYHCFPEGKPAFSENENLIIV